MENYNAFIEEVNSLEVRTIELMTDQEIINQISYTKLLPLWYLNPIEFTDEEKQRLIEKGHHFVKCWDLSHYYDKRDQNIWESGYYNKLRKLERAAINDVASKEHAKMLLKALNQQLVQMKEFGKCWKKDKMSDEANYQYLSYSQNYYQDDLRLYYLSHFITTGVQEKQDGYSTHFLKMLHDLYNVKLASFEWMKTQLTAMVGERLKRGENEFEFDEQKGWVNSETIETVKQNNDSGKLLQPKEMLQPESGMEFFNSEGLDYNAKKSNELYLRCQKRVDEIIKQHQIKYTITEKDTIENPELKYRIGEIVFRDPYIPNKPEDALNLVKDYFGNVGLEFEKRDFEHKYKVWNREAIKSEIEIIESWINDAEKNPYSEAVLDKYGYILNKDSWQHEFLRLKNDFYKGYLMTYEQWGIGSKTGAIYGRYFLFYELLQSQLKALLPKSANQITIEGVISDLVQFAVKNEYDFDRYILFANEASTTFNRYFDKIENAIEKKAILSDIKEDIAFVCYLVVHKPSSFDEFNFKKNYIKIKELFLNRIEHTINSEKSNEEDNAAIEEVIKKGVSQILYNYDHTNIQSSETITAEKRLKILVNINKVSFSNDLTKKNTDEISEFLSYHFRNYIRKVKGESNVSELKERWLAETKKTLPAKFDLKQRDIFLSWFEQNENLNIDEIKNNPTKERKSNSTKNEFVPKIFAEIFKVPNQLNDCLNLLRQGDNRFINEANEVINAKSNKGVFIVWLKAIEYKALLNYSFSNDNERAATLNHNFKGLNISPSLFRQPNQRAKENFKSFFEAEIAAIRS